jgi:prolipoprotein diacylglyceryl transferase
MQEHFVWSVNREIFNIYGNFGLRWYTLLFLAGILIGQYCFKRFLKEENRDEIYAEKLLYYIFIGTVVGARLGHCFFYDPAPYLANPIKILMTWEGGLASHGGYTGVIIALIMFVRKYPEFQFFWLADRISILGILAGAFIRVGNFFNSEIIGLPSELPWAVVFSNVDQIPRHPAQLYEALTYYAIAGALYLAYRFTSLKLAHGRILGLSLSLAFAARTALEAFKENQEEFEQGMLLNMGQLLSIPFIIVGLLFFANVQSKLLPRIETPPKKRHA